MCFIDPVYLSDHAAVKLTVRLDISPRKNIWKMNNSLLQDNILVEKMTHILAEYVKMNKTNEISPVTLWEGAKAVLRGHIISYASSKYRTRIKQHKQFVDEIKN